MNDLVRFTKTFTETQRNDLVGGEWKATRVSEVSIDDMINGWVHSTKNVIIDVFSSVEHSSHSQDNYMTKVRYIVTYMEQEAFKEMNAPRTVAMTQEHTIEGEPTFKGGPTSKQIAAVTKQIAQNKAEREAVGPIPVRKDLASTDDVYRVVSTPAGRAVATDGNGVEHAYAEAEPPAAPLEGYVAPGYVTVEELDEPEEAQPWQDEGARPETARMEAEALANELQTALVEGGLPTERKGGKIRESNRVVKKPTPPILVNNQEQAVSPQSQQTPPEFLKGIPTRRKRRSTT